MPSDHPAVEVRPAGAADPPEIAEIWYEGWRDGHLGNVPDELVAVRTRESFSVRASQRIGDTTVAVVDEQLAGFVMVVDDEVEQVYVSRRRRGAGVASALLAQAERLVKANGHNQAWLAVVPGNARARRFYERSGWTDEGLFDYPASSTRGTISVPTHRYVKSLAG
jgi:GNAT superfamily N-acetyltransferase